MKYIILQASIDGPTAEDDGLSSALGFGLASPKLFDTLEEAKAEQELIAQDTLADLSDCYGLNEEDYDGGISGEIFHHSNGSDVEVTFIDTDYGCQELNTTIIRIQEVDW